MDAAEIYVVRVSVPVDEFREQLLRIPEAVLVRELPPGRVVVSLTSGATATDTAAALAGLDGVEAVTVDRLERLHPKEQGGAGPA